MIDPERLALLGGEGDRVPPIDESRDVLFVGGVPLESAEEVMRLCGAAAGDRALSMPDGELGDRSFWIGGLGQSVWSRQASLIKIDQDPDDPVDFGGTYRLKDAAAPLPLAGQLPYAPAAIDSYEVFKRLRDEGVIGAGVRFHVAVPTSHAAVYPYFRHVDEWPIAFDAWAAGLRSDFARIVDHIPADDLVVQFDYCTELSEIHGDFDRLASWIPPASKQERFARYTSSEYVSAMTDGLPNEVLVGYHICAGTYPTQPVSALADMSLPVQLANALVSNTPHRVDYVQMPVMRDSGGAYFAPLAGLDIGATKVYLGIECDDGVEAMKGRIAAAHEYLPSFGVSHYCGYRLDKAPILRELLDDLIQGADASWSSSAARDGA